MPALPTAENNDWNTPEWLLDLVREVIGGQIDLDPCSNSTSKVNARVSYVLPEKDGLDEPWDGRSIFVNPPFGRCYTHRVTKEVLAQKPWSKLLKSEQEHYRGSTVADWVKRCALVGTGSEVFLLSNCAVETKHWQGTIFPTATSVLFFRGRLRYTRPDGKSGPPMFASSLAYWGKNPDEFARAFEKHGTIWTLRPSLVAA